MLLLLIIFAGAFLRFYNLGKESFRVDEATTAITLKNYSLKEIFMNTFFKGQILPGYLTSNLDFSVYYLLLKIWSDVFGINEISLRAFSAIFGSLSIILIYLLAKELFNSKIGIISTLIFSLNVVLIERSQEARLYSFIVFIVLLSAYLFLKYQKTNKNKYLIGFGAVNLLGIYTSPIFIFFFAFEAVYLLYTTLADFTRSKKLKIKKIHLCFLILLVAYLPLTPNMLHPKVEGLRFSGSMSISGLAKIFLQYNSWLYPTSDFAYKINNSQFNLFTPFEWFMVFSIFLLALVLSVFFIKFLFNFKKKDKQSLIFSAMFLVVPFCVFFVVLYKVISIFPSNIYVIYTIPAYFIIASYGISYLNKKHMIAVLIIISLLSLIPIYSYYFNLRYPQYREAVFFLEKNADKNDAILLNLESVKIPFNYYSTKLNNVYGIANEADVKKLSENKTSVWLLLSTKYADQKGLIKKYFNENYKLIQTKRFFEVDLYHYVK